MALAYGTSVVLGFDRSRSLRSLDQHYIPVNEVLHSNNFIYIGSHQDIIFTNIIISMISMISPIYDIHDIT